MSRIFAILSFRHDILLTLILFTAKLISILTLAFFPYNLLLLSTQMYNNWEQCLFVILIITIWLYRFRMWHWRFLFVLVHLLTYVENLEVEMWFSEKTEHLQLCLIIILFDTIALQDSNLIFYSFVEIQGRGLVMSFITVVLPKSNNWFE